MKISERMTLTLALLAAAPAFADAASDKTLRDSERMIARCLDYAASQKYTPLSVGVVDPTGTLIAFRRQDGAGPSTADAALLKARTSLRVNAPTSELGPVANDAPTRDAFLVMQMTLLPGGIPLNDADGRVFGAIGVSGGTGEQDAECARRAAGIVPNKK